MNNSLPISALELRDYASSQGWQLIREAVKDRLYVLSHERYKPRQLVFAMEENAPDYEESLFRAIEKLAEVQHVSTAQLISSVNEATDDTLQFRIISEKAEVDSLPLLFAEQFVENIKKLLQAAACSVANPQLYHPRLSRIESENFLGIAKLRHTQPGSFIFKVSCNVSALDTQMSFTQQDAEQLPFVRHATLIAKRSLSSLVDAIETDTLDDLVSETKNKQSPLLSANFCEALTNFYDSELKNSLDFSVVWSPLLKPPSADADFLTIRVRPNYFAKIEEVQKALREPQKTYSDSFIGTVEELEGEMGEDQRRSGSVVLRLMLPESDLIRARVQLDAEKYEKAVKAHLSSSKYVRVKGQLQPGRQPRNLTEVTSFEFLE